MILNSGTAVKAGIKTTLTATTEPGAKVTVSDGVTTLVDENSSGTSIFNIPNAGEWNVKAEKDGEEINKRTVMVLSNYLVNIGPPTYTVRISLANSNPETACEYIDDAIGMTPSKNGAWGGSWENTHLFKSIKPCIVKDGAFQYYLDKNNLAQKETGEPVDITSPDTGDVMVEIPKIGYRMWHDETYQYVSITEEQDKPDYCYRAHSLDTEGDCDKIYIGAFLGWNSGNKIYSLSGKLPSSNLAIEKFREYAQARGTGYSLISFYPLTLLQCLYLIKYKNRNSEIAIGQGYSGKDKKTGSTITKGEDYGNPLNASEHMCFLNIEDFWGNFHCLIDGLFSDGASGGRNIKTAFKNFNDNGLDYPYIKPSETKDFTAYIKNIQGTNEGGFVIKTGEGSNSTYYIDVGSIFGVRIGTFGGGAAFSLNLNTSPSQTIKEYLGCRLMFKHKKEVTE